MLGGIVITWREVITVARREQIYIFMKHEDLGYHELHYFRDGLDSSEKLVIHMCYKIVNRRRRGGGLQSDMMSVRLLFVQLLERV